MAIVSPRKCTKCTKRIQAHKPRIACCLCENKFHLKCNFLTPSDVDTLIEHQLYRNWSCHECNSGVFPFFGDSQENTSTIVAKKPAKIVTHNCHTCSKMGYKLKICELCGNKSHLRCFAGIMGCRGCLRDIYPGYDTNVHELFTITGYNTALFNPYNVNSDINYIGTTDR